jgi:hypothetical protein
MINQKEADAGGVSIREFSPRFVFERGGMKRQKSRGF